MERLVGAVVVAAKDVRDPVVEVVDDAREVVGRRAVTKMRVHDHPELFELVEVPVDRREMDVGRLLLHHSGEVLCRAVAVALEECAE